MTESTAARGPARSPMRWLRGLVLDLRSLALFRVAVGCCLLTDLALRIPQIDDFYADDGVLPREALFRLGDPWRISLHFISGNSEIQLALFLCAVVLAVGFVLGYHTRFCAAGSWVLLVSMHARNPMVAHGGDSVLRMLLFWSIFLPVNARFSLDRSLNPPAPVLQEKHLSPAGIALIFQICAIYWYAFAEKMDPVWVTERSAIYYALNLDMFSTQLGRSLLQYPELMHQLTTATLALELLGPVLAISPVLTAPLRFLMVASFLGFHAGMGLSLRLGLFPWICAAAWLALLPGGLWDFLGRRFEHPGTGPRPIAKAVSRLREFLPSSPAPRETGLLGNLIVLGALLIVTLSLLFRSTRSPGFAPTGQGHARALFSVTSLGQQWRMFAPRPSPEDGWFVLEGVLRDGRRIDLLTGDTSSDARPDDFGAAYRNTQWLGYLVFLWNRQYRPYRTYFGRYLCRRWNDSHQGADQVDTVFLYFMLELTPPEGTLVPEPTKERVLRRRCFDKEMDR